MTTKRGSRVTMYRRTRKPLVEFFQVTVKLPQWKYRLPRLLPVWFRIQLIIQPRCGTVEAHLSVVRVVAQKSSQEETVVYKRLKASRPRVTWLTQSTNKLRSETSCFHVAGPVEIRQTTDEYGTRSLPWSGTLPIDSDCQTFMLPLTPTVTVPFCWACDFEDERRPILPLQLQTPSYWDQQETIHRNIR